MWVILCPWHILQFTDSDDGSAEVSTATLDELRTEVLELFLVLIKLNGVALDGTDGTARYNIGVEAVLFHCLLLLHRRTVGHVEGLAECPLDVVVIGRQVEEVLVEELDMCFGFHHEVGFLQAALCKEGDVSVKDVYLAALFTDKL